MRLNDSCLDIVYASSILNFCQMSVSCLCFDAATDSQLWRKLFHCFPSTHIKDNIVNSGPPTQTVRCSFTQANSTFWNIVETGYTGLQSGMKSERNETKAKESSLPKSHPSSSQVRILRPNPNMSFQTKNSSEARREVGEGRQV